MKLNFKTWLCGLTAALAFNATALAQGAAPDSSSSPGADSNANANTNPAPGPSLVSTPRDRIKFKELLTLCEGDAAAQRECDQFIRGVASGVYAQQLLSIVAYRKYQDSLPKEVVAFLGYPALCIPEGETDEAIRQNVIQYSKEDREQRLNASAGSQVLLALGNNYICRKP
jgi:hypothetical protein